MRFRNVHFIINPVSGKEEPILSWISKVFCDTRIRWDVSVTRKDLTAGDIAKDLIGKTDLVIVYGGDGSVTETAAALQGTGTPMAIVPGGTANVMAKELGIPQDSVEALELLIGKSHTLKGVDMGSVNGKPFLLRVNLGIMADMVLEADRKLKDRLGQLAYGITAVKSIAGAEAIGYELEIDGKICREEGVSLTVTNSGNVGIGDYDLQPGISITDGLLDIILLKNAGLGSILKAAGSALLQQPTDAVKHWKCRQVIISLQKKQRFICDDREESGKKIDIRVVPAAVKILVPKSE
ncbi:diacylglycerol/lipid kinase family protein [Hufsiella ginkgonis]|uniref:YegS/Rv2252/BmrU family lipid kinase n=1 Tax=Hufsiella ginkgonis TaxID=2695274 RepID=A0A7K1XWJ5_9SPHI|nr:diacylglycerol kinase family protein [Hufsiella ginkgonis]MXV15351.1 YegS/Rv2252/BmrU family lipid kinase [Hufsiella ginkgonis]